MMMASALSVSLLVRSALAVAPPHGACDCGESRTVCRHT